MKKGIAAILLAFIILGSLATAVAYAKEFTMVGHGWGPVRLGSARPWQMPFQRRWVDLKGRVNTFGTQEVNGTVSMKVMTTSLDKKPVAWRNRVTAIWNDTASIRENGNLSYVFYSAKLIRGNFTAVNFEETDFFLNGTWNVFDVTLNREVIRTGDEENGYTINVQTTTDAQPLATKAYGELKVTSDYTEFTLDIEGVDELTGVLRRFKFRNRIINKFKIGTGESDTVTQADLATLSRNYGAMPYMENYDESMDFNFNYRIDIADIATVAANIE